MKNLFKKLFRYVYLSALLAALMTGCAPGPGVTPEPEPEPVEALPPPAGFVMKPFHRSMKEEMRTSYDRANEIIAGVFTGIHRKEDGGLIYYFSDFSRFDKDTLTWGPARKVIMQVHPNEFKPEIIRRNEFKRLIELDKTGICWDYYQGNRNVFLVEGRMNLLFLEAGFEESSDNSYRHLLDAYPMTDECRAKYIFNLMIRDQVLRRNGYLLYCQVHKTIPARHCESQRRGNALKCRRIYERTGEQVKMRILTWNPLGLQT